MANLIYVANTSLDGYTEDKDGKFDWTEPSEEYFRFITNLVRVMRTHLYGRRMYETMMVWETDPNLAAESPLHYKRQFRPPDTLGNRNQCGGWRWRRYSR
jgi:dihydrofolate reductase